MAGFLAELRRRRVPRAGLLYLVAAWVVVQVADTVFPHLGLPTWAVTLVIALCGLGLPFAVLFAWLFDLTPSGVQRTSAVRHGFRSAPAGAAAVFTAGAVLGAAGVMIAVRAGGSVSDPRPTPASDGPEAGSSSEIGAGAEAPRSIAVLPFVDLSADGANEYFSDGLTEELLNALAQVEGLRVAARTSSFAYKGRNLPVKEIAAELGVRSVLGGSVRKAGNELRITAQLVDSRTGYHLWSASYDRTLEDVFAIQEELARSIVSTLKGRLVDTDLAAVATRITHSPAAYDAYLRARHLRRSADAEDELRQAIALLDEAIALDPRFAAAHAEQAQAFILMAEHIQPTEVLPRAKAAALRALELDSALVETRLALASVRLRHDWDWTAAEREYRRATSLDPGSATAAHAYADFLFLARRFDDAHAELERGLRLDSITTRSARAFRAAALRERGFAALSSRDYDAAARYARGLMENDPSQRWGPWLLGQVHLATGGPDSAVVHLARVDSMAGGGYPWRTHLGLAYARAGRRAEAEAVLAELLAYSEQRYVGKDQIGALLYYLGRRDEAVIWLSRAFDDRHWWLPALNVNPLFEPLREDPAFAALLRRMNVPGDSLAA